MRLLHGGRVSGLLALTLLFPSYVSAKRPEQMVVRWAGAASCPRPPALEAEVLRLLGTDAEKVAPMRFEATVERLTPEGYELTLEVEGGARRARRGVRLATCEEVHEAAALLIASAIDPDLAPPREDAQDVPEEPARERTVPRWALTAQALFDAQSLPRPTAGAGLGVALDLERLRLWADARYFAPARVEDGRGETETAIDLFAGALGTALVFQLGRATLGPALELEAGLLRGRSEGVTAPERAQARWGSGFVGAITSYPVHPRASLSLSIMGGAPWSRPRFALREERPFYTTAAWTFRLALGVRFSLRSR